MRNLCIYIIALFFFSSCAVYQDIEVQEVRDVRITKLTATEVEGEIDLKLYNPNNYKLSIVSVNADFYLNDKDIGDAKLRRRVTLGKKSSEIHTIKLEGDYSDISGGILESLLGSIFSQTVNVKVDGTIKGKALLIGKSFYFKVDQDVRLEN